MARERASANSVSLAMGNVKHFRRMPANAHGPAIARGGHAILFRQAAPAGNRSARDLGESWLREIFPGPHHGTAGATKSITSKSRP